MKIRVGDRISCTVFEDDHCTTHPKNIEQGTNTIDGINKGCNVYPPVASFTCAKEAAPSRRPGPGPGVTMTAFIRWGNKIRKLSVL
jgi:hypothetical protein